ncbi:MAG: HlyD family efflux transporter periplasmic adaptor subunit [Magnetospirillum sp.]|nr:HlyD family efflux transporter periplasmic adaptor subunit [Magnetospirillum sp.]
MNAAERTIELLDLQRRVREADSLDSLAMLVANQPALLAPCRQAMLWIDGLGLMAASGLSAVDRASPFGLWADGACRALFVSQPTAAPVTAQSLPASLADQWNEWLPSRGLWLPMNAPDGAPLGGILVARDHDWDAVDQGFLAELAHAQAHALAWFVRPRLRWRHLPARLWAPGRRRWVLLAALAALGVPVPLTVLAPAEIVAIQPAVIRAPLDGVVETVHVRPNQKVGADQVLFTLNDRALRGKLEVTEKTRATAEAEYRLAAQQAVYDSSAKGRLSVLAARLAEREAELVHVRNMLDRSQVRAPAAGLVVMDAPEDWVGRPVTQGERVMAVTDGAQVEVEAWLGMSDAVELEPGMAVRVFLHADPLSPVSARLRFAGYEGQPRPEGGYAYRLRAELEPGQDAPRLGRKGTARVTAGHVPLVYWLLRRPLAAIRHFTGL